MKITEIKVFPDDQATGLWNQHSELIELSSIHLSNEVLEDLINMQMLYNKQDFYKMDEDETKEVSLYFEEFSKRIAHKIKILFPTIPVSYLGDKELIYC